MTKRLHIGTLPLKVVPTKRRSTYYTAKSNSNGNPIQDHWSHVRLISQMLETIHGIDKPKEGMMKSKEDKSSLNHINRKPITNYTYSYGQLAAQIPKIA